MNAPDEMGSWLAGCKPGEDSWEMAQGTEQPADKLTPSLNITTTAGRKRKTYKSTSPKMRNMCPTLCLNMIHANQGQKHQIYTDNSYLEENEERPRRWKTPEG